MSGLSRRSGFVARLPARWWRLLRSRPAAGEPRVWYGRDLPPPGAEAGGGIVKFQRLQEPFPNTPLGFNLAYLGSNTLLPDAPLVLRLLARRGIPLVWNQDGVAYRAWRGGDWWRLNERMAVGLSAAAHVVYQSEFCKLAADRFLGEPAGSWEVLHNPADIERFAPAPRPKRPLTLLLGGNQYERYRLETALETLALLDDARLLVTGHLSWTDEPVARAEAWRIARALGVAERVELLGPYAQRDAPSILHRGDVLLHTKVNDPCPGVVVEAMACGLPVVHSATGGVPELVGDVAGLGVPQELEVDQIEPPDPELLAAAVHRIAERLDDYAAAARARAVERFSLAAWVERHRQIFERLAG